MVHADAPRKNRFDQRTIVPKITPRRCPVQIGAERPVRKRGKPQAVGFEHAREM
jgi:hypothetical protein